MAVTRDSLRKRSRAEQDFYSPMTGGTKIRYTDTPAPIRDTYSSRVAEKLSEIGKNTRRSAPIIKAIETVMKKTDDPFTQIEEKKSYAPQEENEIMGDVSNIGEAVEAVEKIVAPSGGTNQRAAVRRAGQQLARQDNNPSPRMSTAALVARDNRRYGNTFPRGAFGSGSRATIERSPTSKVDLSRRHSVGGPGDQPGINVVTGTPKQVSMGTTFTGIGTREFTKSFTQPKTQVAKQSVASLPSNYKSTEAAAFAAAKAYQEAKGIAARNPNVKVGVDSKGRPTARAVTKTRAEAGPAARTAQGNAARVRANNKARAQAAAVQRKLSGTTTSAARAAAKAAVKAAAKKRHASFKARRSKKSSKKSSKKGGKSGSAGCPDPMMLILMANGSQKRAGDLMVGDLIKTNHEKDMKLGEYKVEYVNVLSNREKAKFTFEENEIVCSLTHKFYVDNDWKEAKDMVIGDEVSGQKLISIENVENGDVVHITVEDAHTYICEGLLSHNKRCDIKSKHDISPLTNNDLDRDDLAKVAYFVRALKEVEL